MTIYNDKEGILRKRKNGMRDNISEMEGHLYRLQRLYLGT